MKDKVSELRDILNKKKIMEVSKQMQKEAREPTANAENEVQDTSVPIETSTSHADESSAAQAADSNSETCSLADLQSQIEELQKANEMQKEMYLRKVADFENFKKRLTKEQDEFNKYASEKILEEFLPVIDSLEMTLSHVQDPDDPIASGVTLVLKQLMTSLEKHGVSQTSGEGEDFDPNVQEAIGTENVEGVAEGKVVKVHRKGYKLHNKVLRAAMVTVSG